MRKITFAAVSFALLAGCASDRSFLGFGGKDSDRDSSATRTTRTYDGESAQTRAPVIAGDPRARAYDGGSVGTPGYVTHSGAPYSESAIASQYRLLTLGERYWPPVYINQAFPPQDMQGD